jgi:hypothetical protein
MTSGKENNENAGAASGQESRQPEGTSDNKENSQSILERQLAERDLQNQQPLSTEPAAPIPDDPAPDLDPESSVQNQQPDEQPGVAPDAPAPEETPAEKPDASPEEEEPLPEQLGDGLSILGAVGLEKDSLEAPTASPEVIQPDKLASPDEKAFPVPPTAQEGVAAENQPDQTDASSLPIKNSETNEAEVKKSAETGGLQGDKPVRPTEETFSNQNPVEAPKVEEGATQSDVLTGEETAPAASEKETPDQKVSEAPAVQEHNPPARAAGGEEEEEPHEEEHDLDEHHESDVEHLSLSEVQTRLFQQLKEPGANKNPRQVFMLHRKFEQLYNAERSTALERFIQQGGAEEDFEYGGSKTQQEVEQAMQQFRDSRQRDYRQEEEQKNRNLARKKELLAQLRELVEAAETGHHGEKVKGIQAEWKAAGPVPPNEAQELWNSYHALLDIYYNNRGIYNELKELDRKRNHDLKVQLCERAEALVNESSINKSLQELRHLHEEWKNVGPVPNEVRDSIWERFIQASEQVHQRKKEYLARRSEEEGGNLRKKQELISRIEPLPQFSSDRINDWREKTDEIQKLKEEWDKVGLVPKADADHVNKRFWGAYKAFFQHKNQFFKSLDEQKLHNLRLKNQLCEEAEALKDHPDWNETREKFIQLQKKWKTIGRVPDKHSDKIWDRFRTACNAFFDRKNQELKEKEVALDRQSAEKEAFYAETAEKVEKTKEGEADLDELNNILQRWDEVDAGNRRVNYKLEDKFYGVLEKYLQKIPDTTPEQVEQLKFQLQVGRMKSHPDGSQKIQHKEQSIRREISDLENNIRTLQTNIEFFGRSKGAEKLKDEYSSKIAESTQRIDYLKRQLKVLRKG